MKGKTATKLWLVVSVVLFYAIYKATGGFSQAFTWIKNTITGGK